MKADNRLYAARRARLAAQMGEGVALIATAPERVRNRDSHYPYRFDSYFYYLTGFIEPEAVLVVVAGQAPKKLLFFPPPRPPRRGLGGVCFRPELPRGRLRLFEAPRGGGLHTGMAQPLVEQSG